MSLQLLQTYMHTRHEVLISTVLEICISDMSDASQV